MTIRQFALLCGCNPQTLRYYDHVDLLKPVKVDPWSGYRYYDEDQALVFVRIKNLQAAGFAIDEIRELLDKDTPAICDALEAKVAEQEKRLQEIKQIRQSYLAEMSEMQRNIQAAKEHILKAMQQYDPAEEFGLSAEKYDGILADARRFFDDIAARDPEGTDLKFDWDESPEDSRAEKAKDSLGLLNDPGYTLVFERHGWDHAKDFLDECSDLEDGGEYALLVRVEQKKENASMAFANTILGILLDRNPGKQKSLSCSVDLSDDGRNHFWLLKRNA